MYKRRRYLLFLLLSLSLEVKVRRKPRVGELRRAIVVVHEIDAFSTGDASLPARRQRTQGGPVPGPTVVVAGHAGVVPRRHARAGVRVVDLTLVGDALFVASRQVEGLVQLRPVQEVAVSSGSSGVWPRVRWCETGSGLRGMRGREDGFGGL